MPLAAFLKTQHHLFIVVNEFRETVGLLSLEDVIEALLGQKIIDEYDVYGDIRKAATLIRRKIICPQKLDEMFNSGNLPRLCYNNRYEK